jgi:hypothetical protein
MPTEYQRRPTSTAEERLFKKAEQKIESAKAWTQYQADESAKIKNMQRLRELRLEREKTK